MDARRIAALEVATADSQLAWMFLSDGQARWLQFLSRAEGVGETVRVAPNAVRVEGDAVRLGALAGRLGTARSAGGSMSALIDAVEGKAPPTPRLRLEPDVEAGRLAEVMCAANSSFVVESP